MSDFWKAIIFLIIFCLATATIGYLIIEHNKQVGDFCKKNQVEKATGDSACMWVEDNKIIKRQVGIYKGEWYFLDG